MLTQRRTLWTISPKALRTGALALLLGCGMALAIDPKPAAQAATSKPAPLTSQQKKEQDTARVLDFFKNYQPDVYEKALKLRETEPAKFEQLIAPAIYTVNYLANLKKDDPSLYALKMEDYNLTFQIEQHRKELRRPDLAASEHDRYVAKLEKFVARQFEVGQEIRRHEIAAIQERVAKLQAVLDEREKNKDATIKHRIKDLVPVSSPPASAPAK